MKINEIRTQELKEKEQLNEVVPFLIPIILKLVMSKGAKMAAGYLIRKIGLQGTQKFVLKLMSMAKSQLGSHGGKTLSKALMKKGKKAGNWGLTHSPADMMDRLQDLANYVQSGAEGPDDAPPPELGTMDAPGTYSEPKGASPEAAAAVAQVQKAQDAEQAQVAQARGGRGGIAARAQARAAAGKA